METMKFADGEGYERFMGQWSRAAGRLFLDWLALPQGLKWLDVGCRTGAFTETIEQKCAPAEIVGIDPAETHVAYAQSRYGTPGMRFEVVDARALGFVNDRFDIAVSALVLNFIPDREKAVGEMRRVVRSGGTVAAYVWDFAGRRGNSQHLNAAMMKVTGGNISAALNAESTTLENLCILFDSAGLAEVETCPIDIQITYADLDTYWKSNTSFASPMVIAFNALDEDKKQQVREVLKEILPVDDQGHVSYSARVNAVKGLA